MKARLFTREKRIREVQGLERRLFSIEDERGGFVLKNPMRKERQIVPYILGHNDIYDVEMGPLFQKIIERGGYYAKCSRVEGGFSAEEETCKQT